jgi:hypothetical protein
MCVSPAHANGAVIVDITFNNQQITGTSTAEFQFVGCPVGTSSPTGDLPCTDVSFAFMRGSSCSRVKLSSDDFVMV